MEAKVEQIDNPHKIGRNAAILYPQSGLETGIGSHFKGMTKLESGASYWVEAWIREVKGKTVLELKFNPAR
jgi:hypothetical protein